MDLAELGMAQSELSRFHRAYTQSHGAVLVTGPTGSGKSTTLYAALSMVNTPDRHIVTIEDPVEYQLDGITQIQVNPRAGLTFAPACARSVRADPDVIMVGEIRDRETAQIAIEAALTGHLVLSTLHTNDAATSIHAADRDGNRAVPRRIGDRLRSVAQRLVRVLCPQCKRRVILPMATLREYGYAASFDVEGYEPVGCKHCAGSGYRGRTGIYEVMTISAEVRRARARAAVGRRDPRVGRSAGNAHAQGRRPRQGQAGANLDCRDRARRQRRSSRGSLGVRRCSPI